MSRKEELIQILCERYHEDEKELQEYNEKELAELLHELEDHSVCIQTVTSTMNEN